MRAIEIARSRGKIIEQRRIPGDEEEDLDVYEVPGNPCIVFKEEICAKNRTQSDEVNITVDGEPVLAAWRYKTFGDWEVTTFVPGAWMRNF